LYLSIDRAGTLLSDFNNTEADMGKLESHTLNLHDLGGRRTCAAA
jgi:hypothetical protein